MQHEPLFICVNTGYSVQRNYENEDLNDYEANVPEEQNEGKHLFETGQKALVDFPILVSFMLETRCDADTHVVNEIETLAYVHKTNFDRWNPIFKCSSTIEALTILPKIVKVCRTLSWCNIFKDQDFDSIKFFPLKGRGTVVFLDLEAESG